MIINPPQSTLLGEFDIPHIMDRVPDEFDTEFEEKGESFLDIAELLYSQPDRKYTQDELAEHIGRSNTTVSKHTTKMVNREWVDRRDGQTTFSWNTDAHNPASTEEFVAVKGFYKDIWRIIRKYTATAPGTFVLIGFFSILSALIMLVFILGFSLGITQESPIPLTVYLAIAITSFLTGIFVSVLSPLQAFVNRWIWRLLPDDFS